MNQSTIAKLQFISPPNLVGDSLFQLVHELLDNGLTWLQFRRKFGSSTIDSITKKNTIHEVESLAKLCASYHSKLIINDHLWICEQVAIDGIHLGRNDYAIDQARVKFGPSFIIGTSSNSLSDLEEAYAKGANYSGLGPVYPTTTKKDHNPVLGWDKTQSIITNFKQDLPVVLIGGISERDLPLQASLKNCGLALSSALVNAQSLLPFKSYLNNF